MPFSPGIPGSHGDGAGEGEQTERRGDQGGGGQEGGGEEARRGGTREETWEGRDPGSPSNAAEQADRPEDQRLCEAADVRERPGAGDAEKEKALSNICIRFDLHLPQTFSFLLRTQINLQQDCFLMDSFVAGY